MKFVDVESPYNAPTTKEIIRNVRYARACFSDCLRRGEIPYASHIVFTQPGILDDKNPNERIQGIMAGKEITKKLNATTVVYIDLGISQGMKIGIELAEKSGRKIEYRTLGNGWEAEFSVREGRHSQTTVWLTKPL
jgi:hypothetical protein